MKVPDPFESYPTGWKVFDDHALVPGPDFMGLAPDAGDVNRFGARFRLAKSFRGLNLEGYSSNTASGYDALTRVLLTWSAFEQFQHALVLAPNQLGPIMAHYGSANLQKEIRKLDVGDRFYGFIYNRVNPAHKAELDNYFKADPCNVAYLASSIRHIFAHGNLTPNAAQAEPAVVVEICNRLSEFLLNVMAAEFGKLMDAFVKMVYGSQP